MSSPRGWFVVPALLGALLISACSYEKAAPPPTTAIAVFDGSTNDVVVPSTGCCDPGAGVLLTAVSTERQEGFERVVFEFSNDVASYHVRYVPLPVTADGSGAPVALAGESALQITMGATSFDGTATPPRETYAGPRRITGAGGPIRELVQTGDFEAVLNWAIGVTGKPAFRVDALHQPAEARDRHRVTLSHAKPRITSHRGDPRVWPGEPGLRSLPLTLRHQGPGRRAALRRSTVSTSFLAAARSGPWCRVRARSSSSHCGSQSQRASR